MKLKVDTTQFRFAGDRPCRLAELPTKVDPMCKSKKDYRKRIDEFRDEINDLQEMMYAHDRYSVLLVFQAMDAAGKDSTIQHVMSGINPHGVEVHAFQRPSELELDHNYLWRTNRLLPPRGRIGIFNRSYYEEVLVARVHPDIVTSVQKLPDELHQDFNELWQRRYQDIRNMEAYNYHNGMRIAKFFLHLSKDEQRRRFLSRLNKPSKQWKFSAGDLDERDHWDDYMRCYEKCIQATATPECPWYVIPADDKPNMRLIVCQVALETLQQLRMEFPQLDQATRANLDRYRARLEADETA